MKSYCESCGCDYFDEDTDRCECQEYDTQEEWLYAVLKERDILKEKLERKYYRLVVVKEISFTNAPFWERNQKGFKTFRMQKEFRVLIQPVPGMRYVFENEYPIECEYLSYNVNEDLFFVHIHVGTLKDIEEIKNEKTKRGWVLIEETG